MTIVPLPGAGVTLLGIFRDYHDKTADEATLQRFLRAPIADRVRKDLEERMEKQRRKASES